MAKSCVCLAGIDGNGQTEFVYGLTGLEPLVSGKIYLDGRECHPRASDSPARWTA
ncbi:MAG: hypothetical protein ACLTXW_15185 [Christensenellales bacterium]